MSSAKIQTFFELEKFIIIFVMKMTIEMGGMMMVLEMVMVNILVAVGKVMIIKDGMLGVALGFV